ncbi:MAG TPA: TRAM domain-containing protein, partial [Acidimicrobiia bacterium]|nr:TRAM domain-containing protein [Acidimicrobiia bacterium]
LADLQQRISLEKNEALVGQEVEVLTEGPSRKDPQVATARTRTNKVVHLPGVYPSGQFLAAVVERAAPSHLMARLA